MPVTLTFSLYWLLVPAFLAVVGFIAYKTRNLGSGPSDAAYVIFLMFIGLFVLMVLAMALMAFHILTL